MNKTPWIKWYPSDFLNGIADLSPHGIALYTVILCRIYDEGRPIQHDINKLARRCNMRIPQCEAALQSLLNDGKLILSDGLIGNKRAQKEIGKRLETSAKQSSNVSRRWQKHAENTKENKDGVIPLYQGGNTKPIPTRS